MQTFTLSELWRYPVKSMRGARHARLPVAARGPELDRHWMLVDGAGKFLSQRRAPRMALLQAGVTDAGLRIDMPDGGPVTVAAAAAGAPQVQVGVWDDRCAAVAPDPEADRLLSDFLGEPCRIVHLARDTARRVDPDYARPDDEVGFADGFPFLLISQASLDGLNARLAEPVPMLRFRPNLVVDGCPAHAEDTWRRIRIGSLEFRVAKPCSRCIIPTIDPASAQRGAEPLRTLMTYRRHDNRIWFGQNLLHDATGELREGMQVEILETGDARPV